MPRLRLVLMAALSCCVAAGFMQCASQKSKLEKAPATALKPQDDFKATMDAYNNADSIETKVRLWIDFLKRNPNNEYTLGTINHIVQNYYLKQKNDPDGAVKFALENLANLKDEKLKRRGDSTLIRLYGKVGNKDHLRELASQIEARRKLTLDDTIELGDAAVQAKDWDFAKKQGELLLARSTSETIRAEAGEKLSDEQAAKSADRRRGQAFMLMGRAALELNDAQTALAHFGSAAKTADHQYAGLLSWPYEELNLYWAKALLKSGDARAAMDKIAAEAVIQGDKPALEVLQESLKTAGIKETPQQYSDRARPRIAKTMPAFSAVDYDKKKLSWGELKGQVTLLAFWAPT